MLNKLSLILPLVNNELQCFGSICKALSTQIIASLYYSSIRKLSAKSLLLDLPFVYNELICLGSLFNAIFKQINASWY